MSSCKRTICVHCGNEIQSHKFVMIVSCLAFLSGEIEVYRKKIEEDKKKMTNCLKCGKKVLSGKFYHPRCKKKLYEVAY